ncbi:Uncharacterized protein ACO02O_01662 [Dirofilaria immitis]
MSMKLLKEAIELTNDDDNIKNMKTIRKSVKPSKAERDRQQLAAVATTSEYDPESDDFIINSNMQRRNAMKYKKKTKNISLLEESRLMNKPNVLKRNIKYMIYETNCKLDTDKTKQLLGFMNERNRRRKKILRMLRLRNNGVQDHKWKLKKSNNKSVFTDEDFMKIGPDRIKLLQGKKIKETQSARKSKK